MTGVLVPRYRAMAAGGNQFRGLSLLNEAPDIAKLVREFKATTLLDYGSGAGDAYRSPHKVNIMWGIKRHNIRLYDPAFLEHEVPPPDGQQFDGVICSDMLEHVPEDEVDAIVAKLFGHARHFVWASVCTRPAKKCFPDGTNLHCTLHPLRWWIDTFKEHAEGRRFRLIETP